MQKLNDLSRSPSPLDPDGTLIAVIEMSLSSWLVAGIVPGVERQPLKKLAVDESALLKLLHRWREEAAKAGHQIKRIECGGVARAPDLPPRQDAVTLSTRYPVSDYSTRWPARQPISQKSASSRVASLKITISSASRAGVR